MATKPPKSDIDTLKEIGALAFGDRWQRKLAEAIGISHATISMILNGKMTMSWSIKRKLLDYLSHMEVDFEARALESRALRARWSIKSTPQKVN